MKRKMSRGKGTLERNRAVRKGFEVRDEDKEGVVYESGMMYVLYIYIYNIYIYIYYYM